MILQLQAKDNKNKMKKKTKYYRVLAKRMMQMKSSYIVQLNCQNYEFLTFNMNIPFILICF